MRISDWSSDVFSSDLHGLAAREQPLGHRCADEARHTRYQHRHRSCSPLNVPPLRGPAPPSDSANPETDCGVPALSASPRPEIGRAHVCTPVTNAQLVFRLLLEKTKTKHHTTLQKHTTT